MKHRMLVAALVFGLLTLGGGTATAQGPDPTLAPAPSYQPMPAADPVAAVNGYLDAFVAKQWSTLPSLTCSLERDSIASSYDPAAQTVWPREVVEALYDALAVEITDRSVTLVSGDAASATVRLDGTLAWSVSDEALRTFVDALAAQSSPAPSVDEKEQFFQGLRTSLDTQVLAPEVRVVAEGGGWLICADIVTEAVEPSPSPVG